jgi:hypothetical protein
MAADVSYQNVVHKRMGAQMFVIPTGCSGVVESGGVLAVESGGVVDIESGAALKIGGTAYVDTAGKVVQQYENFTSGNIGTALANYGVTYISAVALASTFVFPTGTANVEKTILIHPSSAVATLKSSGNVIISYDDTSTTLATMTASTQAGAIRLIATSTAVWRVISKSTSITLS